MTEGVKIDLPCSKEYLKEDSFGMISIVLMEDYGKLFLGREIIAGNQLDYRRMRVNEIIHYEGLVILRGIPLLS